MCCPKSKGASLPLSGTVCKGDGPRMLWSEEEPDSCELASTALSWVLWKGINQTAASKTVKDPVFPREKCMTARPRLSQSWSLHSSWVLSAEVQVGGGKKRHRLLGTWLSISQSGDHRLSLVILCVVMKPDERSPACSQPAVVLKMQTTASGIRQRKEVGLCPPLLVLASALATCRGKAGLYPCS